MNKGMNMGMLIGHSPTKCAFLDGAVHHHSIQICHHKSKLISHCSSRSEFGQMASLRKLVSPPVDSSPSQWIFAISPRRHIFARLAATALQRMRMDSELPCYPQRPPNLQRSGLRPLPKYAGKLQAGLSSLKPEMWIKRELQ